MKKLGLFFILLSFMPPADAQDNSDPRWKFRLSKCTGAFAYLYQNENLFQFGPKFELIKTRQNISIIPSVQLSTRHVTYLNPVALLRYYQPIGENIAATIALEYSHRQILGQPYDNMSPEIGIVTHDGMNFVVGYNFALTQLPAWAWKWRIGIRLMLF